eukprot:TRINITY_DN115437_c0_g1_i1.p1 TRINITY_DN115437_c0_g1~~TRINITY_DN115437_c0_g1_i1.p1  ORF type:complete len:384 (-),score=65.24 TRINITY_DN115437_c0_g1_i1:70-1221(-)
MLVRQQTTPPAQPLSRLRRCEAGAAVGIRIRKAAVALSLLQLPSAPAAAAAAGRRNQTACWSAGLPRENCCDLNNGPRGNLACWTDPQQYDRCCLSSDPLAEAGEPMHEEAVTLEMLEHALGAKLDRTVAESSLEEVEASLRSAIEHPEKRQMAVRMSHAFLAVILSRQGRRAEAEAETLKYARHDFSILENGMWQGTSAHGYHMHDAPFSRSLAAFLHERGARSVGDFGCGLGYYVRDLRAAGFRAGGFDGNPNTPTLSEGRCMQADLAHEFDLGTRWDWVLSLEVAEHIPRRLEAAFLSNLDRHATFGLIISWGNQAGEGHVNVRSRAEVQALFEARGFWTDEASAAMLREAATLPWLKNCVLVFKRAPPLPLRDRCAVLE